MTEDLLVIISALGWNWNRGGTKPKGGRMIEKPNSELFGAWVIYSHILKRKMRYVETENKYGVKFRNEFKFWKKFEFPGSGIFIGTRTLKNGNREFDCEEGYTFVPTEYITAALICPSPSQNPVYVPMEAFQPVETPLTTGMKGGKMKRSTDNPKSTCHSPTKPG